MFHTWAQNISSVDQMLTFKEWNNAREEVWLGNGDCFNAWWLISKIIFAWWLSYENTYRWHTIPCKDGVDKCLYSACFCVYHCVGALGILCHTSLSLSLNSASGLKPTWKKRRLGKHWCMLVLRLTICSLSALHWQLKVSFMLILARREPTKAKTIDSKCVMHYPSLCYYICFSLEEPKLLQKLGELSTC